MDFYFYGDTNYIEEMFDLSCVDTVISDREEAFKFGFFINRLPDIDDIVTIKTADYEFDPEYDFIGERFIFIVSNDKIGIKEVLEFSVFSDRLETWRFKEVYTSLYYVF